MTNGNGWITKWAIGSLWGILIGVIAFTGNVVKANDVENGKDHTEIRGEVALKDEKIFEKIEKKLDKLEKKMEDFSQEQIVMKIQNVQILEIVNQLKEKTQ